MFQLIEDRVVVIVNIKNRRKNKLKNRKKMTVEHLIRELSKYDKNKVVVLSDSIG